MEDKIIIRAITLIAIGLLFVLGFLILKPILIAIIFALLLAYIFNPIYRKILKYVKKKDIATSIIIVVIVLAITIPLWFLTPVVIKQAFDSYTYLQKVDFASALGNSFPYLFTPEFANVLGTSIHSFIANTFSTILNSLTDFLINIPSFLLQFAVFIFTFYFALRDGDKLKNYLLNLSPFSESTELKMSSEFKHITYAIIYGQVLIGILQGLMVGIGLFIIGFPKAIVLTVLAVLVSIIPVLGSWIIWLPVSIFLIASGQTTSGIFMFLYGLLLISTLDNILRPLFLSKNSNLNIALGVIGTIGGLYFFGLVGLILGPLILAYILMIFDFYKQGKLSELFKK